MMPFSLSFVVIEICLFQNIPVVNRQMNFFIRVFITYIYRSLYYFIIFDYFRAILKTTVNSEKRLTRHPVKGCEWQQYNHQQQQLTRLGVFDCIFPIHICHYISSINHIQQQYFENNGILHSKYNMNYFGIIKMIRGVL